MSKLVLSNVAWSESDMKNIRETPGIANSFIAALSFSLKFSGKEADYVRLMGASAFAFRINIHQDMCPSAPTTFLWKELLPEAIEQAGCKSIHIYDSWDNSILEEKRAEARQEIEKALKQGILPILWEVEIPEWGLITGYDDELSEYTALSCFGNTLKIPYGQFGRGAAVGGLSVSIPGEPNGRSPERVFLNSLHAAVRHAAQEEWNERPWYQDGLPAYEFWASIIEKGLKDGSDFNTSWYSSGTYFSARYCAAKYLFSMSDGNPLLLKAAKLYQEVAERLYLPWEAFRERRRPEDKTLEQAADAVRKAGQAEEQAIGAIREYLAAQNV